MVKFARDVAKRAPFKDLLGENASFPFLFLTFSTDADVVELNPGPEITTDAQIAGPYGTSCDSSCADILLSRLRLGKELLRLNVPSVIEHSWIDPLTYNIPDTAGSLSMLPRDRGGVVDPQLKVGILFSIISDTHYPSQVYGTTNIRCADLSIVPLHFAAHSQGKVSTFSVVIKCTNPSQRRHMWLGEKVCLSSLNIFRALNLRRSSCGYYQGCGMNKAKRVCSWLDSMRNHNRRSIE